MHRFRSMFRRKPKTPARPPGPSRNALSREEIALVIRAMSDPHNIRTLSRTLMRAGFDSRIKENAAKRVVGIRVSELYRRRKAAMLEWARKFNATEMQRLINNGNPNLYNRRVNSIPNPPQTRTNLIKAVIAKYLLNKNVHFQNAVNAVQRIHQAANHRGNNRIPNARLVAFVMGQPTERLRQFNANLPFYA